MYAAPELTMGERYNTAVDVWAFGVVLLEVTCACHGMGATYVRDEISRMPRYALASGLRPPRPRSIQAQQPLVDNLISDCMADDHPDRPDARELLMRIKHISSDWVLDKATAACKDEAQATPIAPAESDDLDLLTIRKVSQEEKSKVLSLEVVVRAKYAVVVGATSRRRLWIWGRCA